MKLAAHTGFVPRAIELFESGQMKLDPSVIAAPAMTSFVDVAGLMSYFLIANQVFKLFGIEL